VTLLRNKVALVTGAGSGIGRAIALLFAREGARVVVSDIDDAAASATTDMIIAQGGTSLCVAADVARPEDGRTLVARTVAHFGGLDVACNNAGIGGPAAETADYPLDGWAEVIGVNLSGVFQSGGTMDPCVSHVLQRMVNALKRPARFSGKQQGQCIALALHAVDFAVLAAEVAPNHG
jgi:NAD(P)-dependent dehydrogenase (short-subunit alcohol dehydrogenase family)